MVRYTLYLLTALALAYLAIASLIREPRLEAWHTEALEREFSRELYGTQIRNFDDYLELEQRLFEELQDRIYAGSRTGLEHLIERYSAGSLADPTGREPDWNRTFTLDVEAPRGGVLLLHGMSDSPYSLRSLARALHARGYYVVGLRLPGHGTVPSALRQVHWLDMAMAVALAMEHLAARTGPESLHIVGYSTGASLAINYTLDQLESSKPVPNSLVLISPAIRVHPLSAIAGAKNAISMLPGLESLAYLSVMDEFDPYKYNSFPTNAAAQVHGITRQVVRRLNGLGGQPVLDRFPRVLVFKSTVDSTVTTEAVVDNLLLKLPADRNELVLFDINRNAALKSTLLVSNPAPLTDRLLQETELPFTVSLVSNENPGSEAVVVTTRAPFEQEASAGRPLDQNWPRGVISLSHVALPFAPEDPLYGRVPHGDDGFIYLGNLAFTGERGLLKIPADWLLRMRYNPFYGYLQQRAEDWITGSAQVK